MKRIVQVRKSDATLFACKCGSQLFYYVGSSGGDGWAGGDAVDCKECGAPYEVESVVEDAVAE